MTSLSSLKPLIYLAAWTVFLPFTTSGAADERPNVVVILTDDQGWGDLSSNGNTNLSTPNIDALAADGAVLEHFFVSPVCSPTRAEFLTGRYHARTGVHSTSSGGERLNLDEKTIADTFKAAGYATGAFGKWHNGMQYPYHPNGRGFDEFYGFCSGHWGNYFSPMLEHNGKLVQGEGFIVDDLTNKALAMVENIDWNVGRILKRLDDLDLSNNTILLFFSDNGPNGWRWNGGMRGKKGWTDEGGVRSPLILRWPGKVDQGRRIPQISGVIDLLPTLADMAGVDVVGAKPLDGISLKPLLLGQVQEWEGRILISQWKDRISVRDQRFRLDHLGRLYDLTSDPGQDRDVAEAFPDSAARLRNVATDWKKVTSPTYGKDDRPFLIGHPGSVYTQIPARDGVAHGTIRRSSIWPNSSYFLNWTTLEDRITWNVEVPAAGDFEVQILYTCPAADVGSAIELSFNDSKLVGKVTEAFDPPLFAAKQNRFSGENGESDVKKFGSLNLGVMHLESGPGQLTLRALNIPASQVMDFRLIMLKRLSSP